MTLPPWNHKQRRNVDELEPVLRERVTALDEPVARPDWQDVVRRSQRIRWRSRKPAWTMAAASVAAGAVALLAGFWIVGTGTPRGGHLPVRVSLQMSDGSHVVLYSATKQQLFVNHADDRRRGDRRDVPGRYSAHGVEATGLLGGPFAISKRLIRSTFASRFASPTPLPGDEEFVSYDLYSGPSLRTREGSVLLSCTYGFTQRAFCEATFRLNGRERLLASGIIDPNATRLSLAAMRPGDV